MFAELSELRFDLSSGVGGFLATRRPLAEGRNIISEAVAWTANRGASRFYEARLCEIFMRHMDTLSSDAEVDLFLGELKEICGERNEFYSSVAATLVCERNDRARRGRSPLHTQLQPVNG